MASVKIQAIIEHLDHEMKRALEDALHRTYPDTPINRIALFREFRKAVGRKAAGWVKVPDNCVKKECRACGEEN